MFGSTILDVLVGVVFSFLAVSLAASTGTEAIASALKLRQTTLKSGIQALLNDPDFDGLAHQLYRHALINPLSANTGITTLPAYIDGKAFSLALIDILWRKTPNAPPTAMLAEIGDDQLRHALQTLLAAADGDTARFRLAVGTWFDDSMERLSGWYKRQTQLIAFLVGLVAAAMLNADPIRISNTLWHQTALAASLAHAVAGDPGNLTTVIDKLDASSLIGWNGWVYGSFWAFITMVGGWLLAAAASLFGAPFWFDALQRIVSIRGTGAPANPVIDPKSGPNGGRLDR